MAQRHLYSSSRCVDGAVTLEEVTGAYITIIVSYRNVAGEHFESMFFLE